MPRQDATPKQTGGGGFDFEDEVVAYFLLHLLAGLPPLEHVPHALSRLDAQEAASEWHLDDVVLTLDAPGGPARVAISIKSNDQFAGGTFPSSFVRDAWEQTLHTASPTFDPDRDWLGFVTAPAPSVGADLDTLLDRARHQSPSDLAVDLHKPGRANPAVRALHDSAACPADLADGRDPTHPGQILRRLVWLPFDLAQAPSDRRARAKEIAQSLVLSGTPEDAETLWTLVKEAASALRTTSGDTDREQLVQRLRPHVTLRGRPDHRADWDRIRSGAEEALALVPHKIGGHVELPRRDEREAIVGSLQQTGAVALLGASGVGKTVLARLLALDTLAEGEDAHVVWASATDLSSGTLEHRFALDHPFRDLTRHDAGTGGLVVLDRLDRLHEPAAFQRAAALLHAVGLGGGNDAEALARWRVVLTCTPEAWDRVRRRLLDHDVPPEAFVPQPVEAPAPDDLNVVWEAFPALQPLRRRRHLAPVLLRPKVLDLLASNARLSLDLETVGESHLASWFWETEVETDSPSIDRGLAALSLARAQADDLTPDTPVTPQRFDAGERAAVEALAADRVLSVRDGRAAFAHDLYGDWVRLQDLVRAADNGGVAAFLDARLQSPVWQRALRLYGLYLLEQGGGLNAWRSSFDALGALDGSVGVLAGDLLLEACAHADGSVPSLMTLWPALVADEGALLDRLLQRLLHSATVPNPVVQERVREMERHAQGDGQTDDASLETYLAATARIPYWPYWSAPLLVLHEHRDTIPSRALGPVARVADLWLRYTPADWPLRDKAADLAIALGEHLIRDKQERNWAFGDGDADRAVHRALLAASAVRTEGAVALLLEAAGRRDQRFRPPPLTDEEIAEAREKLRARGLPVAPMFGGSGREPDPWPDGPAVRVDEALQHVVLETDALQPLVEADPAAAKELLLALLLEHPRDRSYSSPLGDYGLEHPRWYPPFYARGPFRAFLALNEEHGVDAILRLLGHVTDRRIEVLAGLARDGERPFQAPTFPLWTDAGERTFIGDKQVFLWNLQGPDSSGVMASALMALEKHLYDRIDSEEDVTDIVERLLAESDSLAILGLLATVGRYDPSLFRGPLRCFLTSADLLVWTQMGTQDDGWRMNLRGLFGPSLLPEPWHEDYRDWHQMEHRGLSLFKIGLFYFVNDETFEPTFAEARERWAAELGEGGRYEGWTAVKGFVAQFDRANYESITTEDGGAALQFTAPQDLQDEAAAGQEAAREDMLVLVVPTQCRRLLDDAEEVADADALWATAEQLDAVDPEQWEDAPVSVLDAQAGVAAVLALRCEVTSGDRLRWTRTHLLDAAQAVRETYGGLVPWEAQAFAADALPALWARSPRDAEVRQAIAHLAMSGSSDLVGRLTAAVKSWRSDLGDDHLRLLHLIFRRAQSERDVQRLRWTSEWRASSGDNGESTTESELAALEAERAIDVQAFLDGSLPTNLPPFIKATAAPLSTRGGVAPTRRERPQRQADEGLIVAVFNGVPLPVEAGSEWSAWADVWGQAVAETAGALALPEDAPTRDVEGADGPWERFVWTHAAYLSAKSETDEEARTYWEPVLALGPTASFSVSSFLREWWGWAHGRPDDETPARRSGQMAEFVSRHPRWSREDRYGWRPRAELWRLVVGLQNLSSEVWTSEQAGLVEALAPNLQRWATDHPLDTDDLVALSAFLSLPAARGVRLDGLTWIADAVQDRGDEVWTEHLVGDASSHSRVETMVGQLLVSVWTADEAQLRRHDGAFAAFQSLLGTLASRRLPVALELSQRVGVLGDSL